MTAWCRTTVDESLNEFTEFARTKRRLLNVVANGISPGLRMATAFFIAPTRNLEVIDRRTSGQQFNCLINAFRGIRRIPATLRRRENLESGAVGGGIADVLGVAALVQARHGQLQP